MLVKHRAAGERQFLCVRRTDLKRQSHHLMRVRAAGPFSSCRRDSTTVYQILELEGEFIEVCDECGFDGAMVSMGEATALFRSLEDRWGLVFTHSEVLLRTRPTPDTWCAVEYAQHTAAIVGAIEWAARLYVDGRSADWAQVPQELAGEFEHARHECERFDLTSTLDVLGSAATSMAAFATKLTPDEQARTADYASGVVMSIAAVVRHALHDAEHHLLDIRRGIARLQLPAT